MYTKSHLYKLYENAVEKSNNNRKGNPFNNDNDDNLSLALLTTTSSIAEQHFTYESFKASQATTNWRRIGPENNLAVKKGKLIEEKLDQLIKKYNKGST